MYWVLPALALAGTATPFRFLTGHGLALGQGRPSGRGLHAMDSLTLSLRQYPEQGRVKEDFSVETDTDPIKGRLQTGDAGLALQYRRSGFTVGGDAGLTYTSIQTNKSSRAEKVKSAATLEYRYGLRLGKSIAWDTDSAWESSFMAGYDEYGGAFRTWSGGASLGKTWGDLAVVSEVSGFRQLQDAAEVFGYGMALAADWNPGDHLIAIKTGMDWLTGAIPQRTLVLGFGYSYAILDWLDVGVFALREKDLDAEAKSLYRVAGAALSVSL
jgi:hypothetical protein